MEVTEEQTEVAEVTGTGGEPFISHIEELHAAVVEMKDAFEAAQRELLRVQKDDSNLQKEIEVTRLQCNNQSSDILQSLSLVNEEVKAVRETLQSSQMTQQELHATVQTLLIERDLLLDELLKNGAISRNVRSRLWSRTSEFAHSSSGSQSTNDSGVALLSDKTSFQPLEGSPTILSTFFRDGVTGDVLRRNDKDPEGALGTDRSNSSYGVGKSRESLFEPFAVSGSSGNVEEYLNKISQPTDFPHDESRFKGNNKPPPLQMTYDSDSSLTLAAAKSLSLSNSLSQQCGLELDEQDKRRQSRSRSGSARRDLSNDHHLQTSGGVLNCSDGEDGMSQSAVEDKAFKDRHRYHVAKELLETERKYCQTLRTIEDKFANPLKRSDVLTMRDISTLFPDEVFELHVKHCALLAQLEERVALWRQKPAIGDLLERFTNEDGSDVLRLYTSYVNDFPEVLKTFHKLCRSSKEFTHFLKLSLEHPVCRGLDLGAFLLSPVQRMPQYILLFKKMIKFTDPSDPDYSDIKLCLDRLRDYLKRLNDSMEHSFQLVTAGMAPHLNHSPDDSPRQSHHRLSISSSQSEGESQHHHHESLRARQQQQQQNKSRSKSVPRNQQELPIQRTAELTLTTKPGKLKNKSKSHWTVCSASDMGDNDSGGPRGGGRRSRDQTGGSYSIKMSSSQSSQNNDNSISKGSSRLQYSSTNLRKSSRGILSEDSDIELHPSDVDESSDTETREIRRKSSSIATKSLPSFNPKYQRSGSFVSEPNLLEESDGKRLGDNKSQRPLSLYKECPEKYSGNSRQRGNQRGGTMNSLGDESKGKQRVSLRTSLKNIFSLKKRTSRTLQISGPILPSRPSLPISPPTSVPTLRFHQSMSEDHGQQQQHHSLSPERIINSCSSSSVSSKIQIHHHQQSQLQQSAADNDRENLLGENSLASLPVRIPNGSHRFIKNPGIGNNFANPKLPKNPFMAKHFAHDKN